MRFCEQRHRADQGARAAQQKKARQPAAAAACAAGVDQCREELVANEGLAAGQRVPFARIDPGEGLGDLNALQGRPVLAMPSGAIQ
jgi:hypothetical protein